MRRTIGLLVVVGLIFGGVVCWRLWRRQRSVNVTAGDAGLTHGFSDTVEDEARWENEGGAVLLQ
jgi:hypothetical protein